MNNPNQLFKEVLAQFDNDSKWDNADFGKIKTISNTKVGGVGQNFATNSGDNGSASTGGGAGGGGGAYPGGGGPGGSGGSGTIYVAYYS